MLDTRQTARSCAIELLAQGFTEMPIDPALLETHLPPILRGMQALTDSPDCFELMPGKIMGRDEMFWDQEAGLYKRSGKDDSEKVEKKFFFHFHPLYRSSNTTQERFGDFMAACSAINFAAKQIALDIAQEIDRHHANSGKAFPNLFNAIQQSVTITRPLRYLQSDAATGDAYTHLDRGALTIHWYATHPGLVLFDRWGEQHRIDETAKNRVGIFPSKKFAGLFAGNSEVIGPQAHTRFGTLHGVKDLRRALGTRTEDRYSLVSFVHAKLTPSAVAWLEQMKENMEQAERAHPL